jgi:hypothetical protein
MGLVRLKRARRLAPMAPALVAWAAFAVSGVLLAAATRYRAPAEPVVVLLAAAALTVRRPVALSVERMGAPPAARGAPRPPRLIDARDR